MPKATEETEHHHQQPQWVDLEREPLVQRPVRACSGAIRLPHHLGHPHRVVCLAHQRRLPLVREVLELPHLAREVVFSVPPLVALVLHPLHREAYLVGRVQRPHHPLGLVDLGPHRQRVVEAYLEVLHLLQLHLAVQRPHHSEVHRHRRLGFGDLELQVVVVVYLAVLRLLRHLVVQHPHRSEPPLLDLEDLLLLQYHLEAHRQHRRLDLLCLEL